MKKKGRTLNQISSCVVLITFLCVPLLSAEEIMPDDLFGPYRVEGQSLYQTFQSWVGKTITLEEEKRLSYHKRLSLSYLQECLIELYFGSEERAIEFFLSYLNLRADTYGYKIREFPNLTLIKKDEYYLFKNNGMTLNEGLADPILITEALMNHKNAKDDAYLYDPHYEKKKLIERIHKTVEYRRSKK